MKRLGIAGRLLLVLSLAFLAVQILVVTSYMSERRSVGSPVLRLPFADQLDAMVTAFDSAPPEQRALLVRVFSDGATLVSIETDPPETAEAAVEGGAVLLPGLADRLRSYTDTLEGRDIRFAIPAEDAPRFLPRLRGLLNPAAMRITVALRDGTWLVLQRRDTGTLAVGGLPAGTLAGLGGVLLALIMGLAVWWETRPIRVLGAAVRRFGETLEPQTAVVPATGAPELRALAAAINDMMMRITRLDRGRTDMIAAIAHDIRTPLTRLQLRLRKLDPELQDAAERDISEIVAISESAERYAATDLAALDGSVDLSAMLRREAERKGLGFDDRSQGAATIRGNAELLGRCLDNLTANALRYAKRCRLSLSNGDGLTITVDDDGPGIPEEDRERLLQPFERGEPSRSRASGGAGLGLAIAYRVVQRHGGALTLGRAPMGGLRVTLHFPKALTL